MKLQLFIIWLLNLFDYIMTVRAVNKYDVDVEANPIMRFALQNDILFFIMKILLVTFWLFVMYRYRDMKICKIGSWVLLAVYGALAIYHIYLNHLF